MKIINIKKTKESLNNLRQLHAKNYSYNEIKICNIHLLRLNDLAKNNIFSKDAIYVAPGTLWAVMATGTRNNSHNFHNLSPQIVYDALCAINQPTAIYKAKKFFNRYVIVTPIMYKNDGHIIVIIETGARLINDVHANINKLVTMYPKDKVSLKNNELLYKK